MKSILIQLDTDPLPSSFDRVVAVDAGVDEVFSYHGITPDNVVPLVHGAIFTRGPTDLHHTAIFIGGSDVEAGEAVLKAVQNAFFGPMRVSVMIDSNGSNTTAAAAVWRAAQHLDLSQAMALILGGTGPVGFRAAEILAAQGAGIFLASRSIDRATAAIDRLREEQPDVEYVPCLSSDLRSPLEMADLLIAAGAAGAQFLTEDQWSVAGLQAAIDLNAVPPAGLDGIEVTDKAAVRYDVVCYGAIGVGGTKMKLHRKAIERLFAANDQVLDTQAIYALAASID